MPSLDAMFEASVYFQYVNEQAAYVKIDSDSCQCRPGPYQISNLFFCWMAFDYCSFINEN